MTPSLPGVCILGFRKVSLQLIYYKICQLRTDNGVNKNMWHQQGQCNTSCCFLWDPEDLLGSDGWRRVVSG